MKLHAAIVTSNSPHFSALRSLALLFLGSRLLLLTLAWLSTLILLPGEFTRRPGFSLEHFHRWDADWYTKIIENGYSYTAGTQSNIAFFPLFPLLTRLVHSVIPSTNHALLFVSNSFLAAAVLLLWHLVELDARELHSPLRPGDGLTVITALLFTPVTIFMSIGYSESTFLFFLIASLYAARRTHWWLAGFLGLAAALTRNAGALLIAPLLAEALQLQWQRPFLQLPPKRTILIACLLPLLGIGLWAAYLGFRFGDPLLLIKVQADWGRSLTWPWVPFTSSHLVFPRFYNLWFLFFAFTSLALFFLGLLFRLRPAYLLLTGLMLLLNLSANHLESIPRLLSVIFPLYFVIAILARKYPTFSTLWLTLSSTLLALSTALFVNGYWFT